MNAINAHPYYIQQEGWYWSPCKSKTLSGAKVAASRRQMCQGAQVFIGSKGRDGLICKIAEKLPGAPICMNAKGVWRAVDPSEACS